MSERTPECPLVSEGDGRTCPAGLAVPRGAVTTRRTLRAGLALILAGAAIGAFNLFWTAHAIRADNRQRCAAVLADATIPLPAEGTPGRDWEARFEAIALQRALQLGCGN